MRQLRQRQIEPRAFLLVLGPVLALTGRGTVPPDAAALTASTAHQKSRGGEVQRSLATMGTDAAAEAWPILSQAGPALNATHRLLWRYTPVQGPTILINTVLRFVVKYNCFHQNHHGVAKPLVIARIFGGRNIFGRRLGDRRGNRDPARPLIVDRFGSRRR